MIEETMIHIINTTYNSLVHYNYYSICLNYSFGCSYKQIKNTFSAWPLENVSINTISDGNHFLWLPILKLL